MACETYEIPRDSLVQIMRGDDERLRLEVVDDDEQAVPIDGWTKVRFAVKENLDDTVYAISPIDCDITTEGAQGIAFVDIPGSATEGLLGTYVAEFEGEDDVGNITTLLQFRLDILADVIV